jgi:ParB family transcriptional regulator, chromosome partitioning protein
MAKRGLGKGLDALIPRGDFQSDSPQGTQQIAIQSISPNPSQPRNQFSEDSLSDLARSIKEHGILQPLILTPNREDDSYILIAGERRLRAAEIAGLEFVPAIIRDASELERLEFALIENIQREDLSAVEAALAYQRLNDEFGMSHEEISVSVGKSRTAITNTIRLLNLPEEVLSAIQTGQISEGHARALLGLTTKKPQLAALEIIIKNGLNVRQAEDLVRKYSGSRPKEKSNKPEISPEVKEFENELRTILGTKVTLNHGDKGGTVTIHYYSQEELEALINRFRDEG